MQLRVVPFVEVSSEGPPCALAKATACGCVSVVSECESDFCGLGSYVHCGVVSAVPAVPVVDDGDRKVSRDLAPACPADVLQ